MFEYNQVAPLPKWMFRSLLGFIAVFSIIVASAALSRAEARNSTSLAGLPAPLVSMVEKIKATCGSKVISTHRPGARVRGSGRTSEHARGRAADIKGNPRCAYALIRREKWRGGYSTDYAAVNHIHMSWGGREMGKRFAHYRGSSQTRYARVRHQSVAYAAAVATRD